MTKTDRDLWAEQLSGWAFGNALVRQGWEDDVSQGLRALAALWFDTYEDEQSLPKCFTDLLAIAEDNLMLDLDVPRDDADDDEEDDDA